MELSQFKTVEQLAAAIKTLTSTTLIFNVKLSGAMGDGTTDDSTAIQAVFDAIAAEPEDGTGTRTVLFPPGVYIISAILEIPKYINIIGSGITCTQIKLKDSTTLSADGSGEGGIIRLKDENVNKHFVRISDIHLNGNDTGGASTNGLVTYNMQQNSLIENVYISNCSGYGFYIHQGTTTNGGLCVFESCWALDCDDGGWYIFSVGNTFISCHGESGSALAAGKYHFNIQKAGNTFISCRGENSNPIFYLASAHNMLVGCNGAYGSATGALIKIPTGAGKGTLEVIHARRDGGFPTTLHDEDANPDILLTNSPLTYSEGCGEEVDFSSDSTITGWSSYTTKEIHYVRDGKRIFVTFFIEGTSDSTSTFFTLPFASASGTYTTVGIQAKDSGTFTAAGLGQLSAASATIIFYSTMGGAAWTASGSKRIAGQFWCMIA